MMLLKGFGALIAMAALYGCGVRMGWRLAAAELRIHKLIIEDRWRAQQSGRD